MSNPMDDRPGLTGDLYEITVLPETMDEWIDEIYKRKVPQKEAKEVADYLLSKATQAARLDELEKLYKRRGLVVNNLGSSTFVVKANTIKERILTLKEDTQDD